MTNFLKNKKIHLGGGLLCSFILLSAVAAAESLSENAPFSLPALTQRPLTSDGRRGNGSCYWGYRRLPYKDQMQCVRCPSDYLYGIVNGQETCFKCPYRFTLGEIGKKDHCIILKTPNASSFKPF
jgi:hypothetical protein